MKYSDITVSGNVEILASKDFQAIPITVAAPQEGNIVKAGTPLTEDGESTTGSGAVGILLYDVNVVDNPNAAIVVQGIINQTVAEEHSGVTYASALATALPGIVLRKNIGVNESNDSNDQGGNP